MRLTNKQLEAAAVAAETWPKNERCTTNWFRIVKGFFGEPDVAYG